MAAETQTLTQEERDDLLVELIGFVRAYREQYGDRATWPDDEVGGLARVDELLDRLDRVA